MTIFPKAITLIGAAILCSALIFTAPLAAQNDQQTDQHSDKQTGHQAFQNERNNSPEIIFHSNDALKKSGTPFSSALEVDGWIYLAGMLGTKDGALVSGGIVPETQRAMERIKSQLADRGVGMNRIVRCLVILADFNDFAAFNGAYKEFFDGNYPARSTFAAKTLARNARVEIECTARR